MSCHRRAGVLSFGRCDHCIIILLVLLSLLLDPRGAMEVPIRKQLLDFDFIFRSKLVQCLLCCLCFLRRRRDRILRCSAGLQILFQCYYYRFCVFAIRSQLVKLNLDRLCILKVPGSGCILRWFRNILHISIGERERERVWMCCVRDSAFLRHSYMLGVECA